MALELRNKYGQLDISVIDPLEVAKLDDDQQAKLAALIVAVENREAAAERFNQAVIGVNTATQNQMDAHAAHLKVNPALSFLDAQRQAIDAFNSSN